VFGSNRPHAFVDALVEEGKKARPVHAGREFTKSSARDNQVLAPSPRARRVCWK
jgi:hypothetical protein